jgi:hypothetical protein
MPVGDQEATVVVCVNADLKRRGYNPPYDTTQKMDGTPYGYTSDTIIMFHRQVKTCLAGKGYTYSYNETTDYMNQTVVMTLAAIYAQVDVKTTPSALAPAGPPDAALAGAAAPAPAPRPAKKRAAKPARAKPKPRPGKKKAAKKKPAKRAAAARAGKKKAAKRGK